MASGIELPDEDPKRTYTEEEKAKLSAGLFDLLYAIAHGEYDGRPLSSELAQDMHRRLFGGVRDHAGKLRDRGSGDEVVTFGPNFSERRERVPPAVRSLTHEYENRLRELERVELRDGAFVESSVGLAATFHAKFIGIHPFDDGNGRTGRALMSICLRRLGLSLIPIEAAKNEYYAVLNEFHRDRNIQPLVDLLLRLYPD